MACTFDHLYSPLPSLSPFRLQLHSSHMHLRARRSRPHTFVCIHSFAFCSFAFHLPRHHCHLVASISRFKVTWLKGCGPDLGRLLMLGCARFHFMVSVLFYLILLLPFSFCPSL